MKIGVLLGVDFVEPKIDKRVFLIAKALKNAGHEPHIFCWSRRVESNELSGEYKGVPFTRIKQDLPQVGLPFVTKIPAYFSLIRKMMKSLNDFKPDIITSTDLDVLPMAVLGKFFFQTRLVYDVHEHWPLMEYNQSKPLGVFTNYLENLLLPAVDGVVTISDMLGSRYNKSGKDTTVLRTAPFLEDVNKLIITPRDKIREALGVGPDNVLIGYMGSLMPDKGIEMMVESFSELYKQNPETKIRFVIIGGPAKFLSELKDLGTKLGGDKITTFKDFVKHEEIHNYFGALDLSIIQYSSVPWANLAMAHKIIEGFAYGVPVIVKNFKERSEFVKRHKSGFVFSDARPRMVAKAISSLVDSGLIPKLRRNAKREFENVLCWEKQIDNLTEMIDSFE